MRFARLIATLLGLVVVQHAWASEALRYSAVSSWNMPYGRFNDEQLVGGIMYDLAIAIGQRTHIPVTFVVLPRKRVDGAALSGDIDLRCYMTPQWTDVPEQYVWSGPLFEIADVIFGTDVTADPRTIAAIPAGSVISTVIGYGYPALDLHFSNGHLKREDTVDQEKVNLKMTAGRTQYGVSETMALHWYQRITPKHRHSTWRLVISRHDFQCGIPKRGNIAASRILKAIESMKKSNQFEEILRKYR